MIGNLSAIFRCSRSEVVSTRTMNMAVEKSTTSATVVTLYHNFIASLSCKRYLVCIRLPFLQCSNGTPTQIFESLNLIITLPFIKLAPIFTSLVELGRLGISLLSCTLQLWVDLLSIHDNWAWVGGVVTELDLVSGLSLVLWIVLVLVCLMRGSGGVGIRAVLLSNLSSLI